MAATTADTNVLFLACQMGNPVHSTPRPSSRANIGQKTIRSV
jgi:hypothetical protein